ncbi:MAG: hypothetical protein LUO98_05185 [Methanoregula sp.]|nr:hypothetical protein [Methanoregula sp.]
MTTLRIPVILILLACILCSAGCTQLSAADNQNPGSSDTSASVSIAKYQLRLAQPEDSAKLVRMDTDVYNIGEVVEFVIANEKTSDLSCTNNPPSFSVRYQKGTGQWLTRMGLENPAPGNTTKLKPGESTPPYRFVTTGWAPGRYRIVSDCGVSREILLRALPPVIPTATQCPPAGNNSPYIRVNPVSDQYAGEPFTIAGTTNLAAGTELRYSIFAIVSATSNMTTAKLVSSSTTVSGGICGANTWSVDGVIEVSGDYFIGISNKANTVSAVRRFSVLPKARPTVTAIIPAKTTAPGITTG